MLDRMKDEGVDGIKEQQSPRRVNPEERTMLEFWQGPSRQFDGFFAAPQMENLCFA